MKPYKYLWHKLGVGYHHVIEMNGRMYRVENEYLHHYEPDALGKISRLATDLILSGHPYKPIHRPKLSEESRESLLMTYHSTLYRYAVRLDGETYLSPTLPLLIWDPWECQMTLADKNPDIDKVEDMPDLPEEEIIDMGELRQSFRRVAIESLE